jgi:hypothetical protein
MQGADGDQFVAPMEDTTSKSLRGWSLLGGRWDADVLRAQQKFYASRF